MGYIIEVDYKFIVIFPKAFGPLPFLTVEEVVASWDEDYEGYSFCLVVCVLHVPKSILTLNTHVTRSQYSINRIPSSLLQRIAGRTSYQLDIELLE